ncbi:MAG: hypothetical protein KDA57_22445 [Planctomycetales bacterium]|nr:hypothetical protein [Planctomycetales bacterium]
MIVSTIVGGISAFGVLFSFAFAHGSPVIGMIVFGLIIPAASIGKLLGIDDTVTLSSIAFVGIFNFVVAYLVCLAIGFIRFSRSKEQR